MTYGHYTYDKINILCFEIVRLFPNIFEHFEKHIDVFESVLFVVCFCIKNLYLNIVFGLCVFSVYGIIF